MTWVYTHDGPSGDIAAVQIHGPATATKAAGPVVGTLTEAMQGCAPITDAQGAELTVGIYCFNVYTEQSLDGEIRGQFALMR